MNKLNFRLKSNIKPFNVLLLFSTFVSFLGCLPGNGQSKFEDADWQGCVVGIFPENGVAKLFDEPNQIEDFEALTGQEVGSVVWFPSWDDEFPTKVCNKLAERGIIPHLTWELYWPSKKSRNTAQTGENGFQGFIDVLDGKYDAYIDKFAEDAKAFNKPVLMRFLHEFNGNWYVWSGNKNGKEKGGPEQVVKVWRYVVDRFNAKGAGNVKWLWTPHGPSIDMSTEAWNDVSNYWPGDDYVDWIGLDGYNFYPIDPWGGTRPLRDFDNCFRDLYDECAKLGDQPMMIAEFGTGNFQYEDFDKAAWISDAFSKIKTDYPRVKIFTWFNINKEHDWRVNSSPEALSAFKEAMKDPYYIGSPTEK